MYIFHSIIQHMRDPVFVKDEELIVSLLRYLRTMLEKLPELTPEVGITCFSVQLHTHFLHLP